MKRITTITICILALVFIGTVSSCKRQKSCCDAAQLADSLQTDSVGLYNDSIYFDEDSVYEEVAEDVEEPKPVDTNTFQSAGDVLARLAGKTFVHKGGMEIRIRGGRMSLDYQDAGSISVLNFGTKSALIRYRGGMFGEGRYRVRIVGRSLQLIDDEEGFVFNQR